MKAQFRKNNQIVILKDDATIDTSKGRVFDIPPELVGKKLALHRDKEAKTVTLIEAAFDLASAQDSKIQEFSNFAKAECEADITVDDIGILHVDSDTLHDLKTIEELVTDGTSPILVAGKYPSYKCVDGSMVDIGTTEITAIKTAMITRKYMAYSVKLKGLVDAIAAATTVEELDAITW